MKDNWNEPWTNKCEIREFAAAVFQIYQNSQPDDSRTLGATHGLRRR